MAADLVPFMGSLPDWAAAATGLIALHRTHRVEHFFNELNAAGLNAENLADAVRQSQRLGDLLLEAANGSAGCEDEQRRVLLARAFASGVEGGVEIDDAQFFIRAMRNVEPIHMKLLRLISELAGPSSQRLEAAWSEAAPMIGPMRAVLDREGLVEDVTLGISNAYATGSWALTGYGHRFLDFVLGSGVQFDWIPVRPG
jgi:hypothetical protein